VDPLGSSPLDQFPEVSTWSEWESKKKQQQNDDTSNGGI
jgi:hypothetical protein